MLSRQQRRHLARRAQKRQGKQIPEGAAGQWLVAFAQGRGARGFLETEAVQIGYQPDRRENVKEGLRFLP